MLIGVLYAILQTQRASSNLSNQSIIWCSIVFSRICFNSLLDTSTWLLVAILCVTLYFLRIYQIALQQYMSLSQIIALGMPNRLFKEIHYNHSVVFLSKTWTSTHLDIWSTTSRMNLWLEIRNGPIKSMAQIPNILSRWKILPVYR